MRKFLIFALILVIVQSCSAQDARIDELITAYAKQNKFNGSVLVAQNGKILLNKGYGLRNAGDSSRNDENSIYQIGSITKQFTSTVIMKLQEEKKLGIKDKLSKYFPAYPHSDSITLIQLMSHTSGVHSYTDDDNFMRNEVSKHYDRERMMALFKDKPLDFPPGTKWNYSNSGYMLLGYIIEDVTKMSYEKAVRKYIFEKAGMTHSGFDFTHLQNRNKATGYFMLTATGNTPAPIVDSSVSFSAGAIYSTTGDLYKWFLAVQSNAIISETSKRSALTPVMNNYGFGWSVDSVAGKKTFGHSGGIHGFTSNMVSVAEDGTTVIMLSNAGSPHLNQITQSIYAILYNKPYEAPRERVATVLPEEILKQYAGIYDLTENLIVHVSVENGKLIGKPEGQGALELHAEKMDEFFLEEIDARLKFTRNDKNEVTAMTLYQNGREVTGKKR